MKIINVCGARPNFMKIAPLVQAYQRYSSIESLIVHTGQHYDDNMSALFFDELEIPRPDINLEVGSGSHAQQTAGIMERFEPVVQREKPDAVLVVGDVNSTTACSLVAAKLLIPVLHVEAGLRSFDRTMPEEINRIVTDSLSDLLFVTEPSGVTNLEKEGIDPSKIHLVGNVMIDTLRRHLERAKESGIHERLEIEPGGYGLITLHRPATVDHRETLAGVFNAFEKIQQRMPLIFCMHPRTRKQARALGLLDRLEALPHMQITPPLGYLEFLHLMSAAAVVMTDSGGMQEETTILGVPCLTLRDNTERPITLSHGTSRLVGTRPESIIDAFDQIGAGHRPPKEPPPLWDGQAARRIADCIHQHFCTT